MILLDATTRKIQVVLAGAKTTNDSPWVASYVDIAQSGFTMTAANSATGASNGVTAVDVVAAPAASTTRQLKYFSLLNADTVAITATVRYNDNATIRNMVTFILAVGQSLIYNAESGWVVQSYKAGQVLGTATNDDAAAGNDGEFLTVSIGSGAAVNLTPSGTAINILSQSLTPGDWDVTGTIVIENGSGVTQTLAWLSTTSATIPTLPTGGIVGGGMTALVSPSILALGNVRFSFAATTTVFLSARAIWSGSTPDSYGLLRARRKR